MAGTDFEDLATRYDAWFARPLGAWAERHETEAVCRLLSPRPGERILDLGTGTGRYAVAAARRGARVVGVDRAAAMLGIARTRTGNQAVSLVRAEAARLPFRDGSFDAVVAVTSLCFAVDARQLLAETARVLRPGGRLVLGELNRWSLWALLRRLAGLVHPTTYRAAHFRGIRALRALLVAAGLEPVRWEGLLHLPPLDHVWFLRLLDPVERLARRWCPSLGAFLAIEARRPRSPSCANRQTQGDPLVVDRTFECETRATGTGAIVDNDPGCGGSPSRHQAGLPAVTRPARRHLVRHQGTNLTSGRPDEG